MTMTKRMMKNVRMVFLGVFLVYPGANGDGDDDVNGCTSPPAVAIGSGLNNASFTGPYVSPAASAPAVHARGAAPSAPECATDPGRTATDAGGRGPCRRRSGPGRGLSAP